MIKMDPYNQMMMNHTTNLDSKKTLLFARALYDNTADMPRELSFKKGDILNVLENNYDESFGEWWVCSLKNKVGLVPSNRLEPLPLLVNNSKSPNTNRLSNPIYANDLTSSDTLGNQSYYCELPTTNNNADESDSAYFNFPTQSEHTYLNNDVIDQIKQQQQLDVYCDTYQVPKIDQPQVSDTSEYSQLPIDSTYQQLPTDHNLYSNAADTDYMTTSSTDIYNTMSNYDNDYNTFSEIAQENDSSQKRSTNLNNTLQLDVKNLKSQTPEIALAYFQELQTNLMNTCNRIIEFVKSKWTELDSLTINLPDIRLAFIQVKKDTQIICEYLTYVILPLLLTDDQIPVITSITSKTIIDFSSKSNDPELYKRISKLTIQLTDCQTSIDTSLKKLDSMEWYAPTIVTYLRMIANPSESPLNNVVNISRNILIFLRSLSTCVKANISLIFPGTPKSPVRTSNNTPTNEEIDVQSIHTEIRLQLDTTTQNIKTFSDMLITGNSSNPLPSNLISQSKSILRNSTQLVCLMKNHESMLALNMTCLIKRFCELINQLVGSIKMYTTRPITNGTLTHVQIATHELSNHIEEMKKQAVTM